jgi:pimeloyl-ACP methyl ester carboxylesterase
MTRWLLRIAGASVGLLVLALAAAWIFFQPLLRWALSPRQGFADQTSPVAPDYRIAEAWSALPERPDAADATLPGLPVVAAGQAAADVFYVHPTTYVGPRWNGPIDDPRLNADTDRVATRIQASAFSGCCAVYAPRYRQANGMAFTSPSSDGDRALELAYSDVEHAFDAFLSRRAAAGSARPFIVAGHSQGTMLAYRLLRRRISGQPLRRQLVAAYLLGGLITRSELVAELPDLPACSTPTQTGCIVAWNARGPGYRPSPFEIKRSQDGGRDFDAVLRDRLCTNPLSWTTDPTVVDAERSPGALFFDAPQPAIWPGFAGAQCRDGVLLVRLRGQVPRDLMSKLLDHALGAENYHPIEYQLFFVSLAENARARAAAFLQAQPG